jgi:hypothetical protein
MDIHARHDFLSINVTLKKIFFLICFSLLPFPVFSQKLHQGEWKTYTAMSQITDLAVNRASGNIWVATTGGAFRFSPSDPAKNSILALRNSDGLSDNDLTAIATDSSGHVYFGGSEGTLNVYDESSQSIKAINDIAQSHQYIRKQIYQIVTFGPRVYLATGFGFSIYDTTFHVFTETVTKFGSLSDQDTVFALTEANDSIYLVLSGAIAIAPKNAPNLKDPSTWHIVMAPQGANLRAITIADQGRVFVGSTTGLEELTGGSLHFISTGDSISVIRLSWNSNTLFILDSKNKTLVHSTDLLSFSSDPLPSANKEKNISSFAFANSGAHVFGFRIGGADVLPVSGNIVTKIYPDGPLDNYIKDLHFAQSLGKLFVSMRDVGLSEFDPAAALWTGLGTQDGVLPGNSYEFSYYDSIRNKLWLSTGGGGLYSLTNADPAQLKHYGTSEGIPSFNANDPFTIMGKGTLDNHKKFIVPTWAGNGEGLVKTSDGNTFTSFQLNPPYAHPPFGICVQDLDDIYFVATTDNTSPAPFGMVALSPDGSTQVIAGGSGQKLGSASINALVVDQDNGLWCGSTVGIEVLTHSRDFQTGKTVFNKSRVLTFTDQQVVHAIAVDGVGNKWVGTENGLFILSADGSDSLGHFTTANSPLIDNSILTIAIDTKSGEAYLGTPKGISRVSSIFEEGQPDFAKMYVYPNPVIQHSDDDITVTITGLAGGSTVKILSMSGKVVATIDASALGSTVTWNGRDDRGKLLASGVYIAAAASSVSSEYGMAKFVLIRK